MPSVASLIKTQKLNLPEMMAAIRAARNPAPVDENILERPKPFTDEVYKRTLIVVSSPRMGRDEDY